MALMKLQSDTLHYALKTALVCASTDKSKERFNVVEISAAAGKFTLQSTDGHCGVIIELNVVHPTLKASVLTADTVRSMLRVLPTKPAEIGPCGFTHKALRVRGIEDIPFTCADTEFPKLRGVYPPVGDRAGNPGGELRVTPKLWTKYFAVFGQHRVPTIYTYGAVNKPIVAEYSGDMGATEFANTSGSISWIAMPFLPR